MNDINTERIKSKFYDRLREEERLKNKKAKLTPILAFVGAIGLTSITILAANLGIFDTLFSNFNDVYKNVQSSNAKVKSNGITMQLSSYLADNKGIVPELVFTKNDGSSFPSDTMAVYTGSYGTGSPSVKINNVYRTISPENKVSDDGKSYYCLPIIHYDIEDVTNSIIDISIDKLVYNMKESNETIDLDLYSMYKNATVKTYDIKEQEDIELMKMFDNVTDNPIQTKIGTTIDSIVFAKVKDMPMDSVEGMPSGDGVDLAAISSHKYDNIVAIKFTDTVQEDGVEYNFQPVNLVNNDDPLRIRLGVDSNTSYQFFRVNDFEDLKDMNGINFIVNSNNFTDGNWNIKTNFEVNQNQSTTVINKTYNMENKDTTITLTKADISLFSTELRYEVKDSDGNLLTDINGIDMNDYLTNIGNNKVKLLYSDGREIDLINYSYTSSIPNGVINICYDIEMSPDIYTLMNTSKLSAIVINDETFKIN
ncbi:MAG: DUF4179 domain-containing protein [Clostridiales bacterium]|jgi:hypothetical protein|nr:DUF4179 domain-containing protein [Clostridiales bacterium]